jgi:hypothetical protein
MLEAAGSVDSMFPTCSHEAMTNLQHPNLIDHIDAAMAAMAPTTAARLTHPDRGERRAAIAIMAQTLAARMAAGGDVAVDGDASASPLLPIEP